MSDPFEQQKPIPGVKNVILVGSGKGGVGKSTVSTHLTLALKSLGASVGLLDADIYGPSLPRMMGTQNLKPEVLEGKIQPLIVEGIKTLSIGNLVEEDLAVVWRGPMLFKAIQQFLFEVEWGPLDYLIIDLPPGTGDIQLSLAQKIPIQGAIAVTTPQNVALADVKKAIDMWRRVNIPILGVVENMAYFESPTGEKTAVFHRGEIDDYLQKEKLQKLAEISLNPQLSRNCEVGVPLFFKTSEPLYSPFIKIAQKILSQKGNS